MEIASLLLVCGLLAQTPPAAEPAAPGDVDPQSNEVPLDPVDLQRDRHRTSGVTPAERKVSGETPAADKLANPGGPAAAAPSANSGDRTAPHEDAKSRDAEGAQPANQPPAAPRAQLRAGEILRDALLIPQGANASAPGGTVTLAEVLASQPDRAAQRVATAAYWKLAEALAEFNYCQDELDQLLRLKPAAEPGGQDPAAQTARWLAPRLADARARSREADSSLVAAQYSLAERMRLPPGQPPPLPADLPHVGPYYTNLNQVYSGRLPPLRAVLADRTLPLRHEGIGLRAASVQAALDAVEALEVTYHRGETDLPDLLAAVDHLARQRRAFMAAVREYNDEIAEYALSSVVGGYSSQALAAMLIRPRAEVRAPPTNGRGIATPGSSGVEHANFNDPIVDPRQPPAARTAPPPKADEPTPAPPQRPDEPTPAPPHDAERGGAAPGVDAGKHAGEPHAAQKPDATADGAPDAQAGGGGAADDAAALGANIDHAAAAATAAPQGLYPALVGMSPPRQAQQLAEVLHWDRELPAPRGVAAKLSECLATTPIMRRRTMIDAYWAVREQTARYHVLTHALEQLDELTPLVAADAAKPAGADAMLLVQADRRAIAADIIDARVAILQRQLALTELAGRDPSGEWLLPTTAPHAGGYRLKLDAQSPQVQGLIAVRRAAASIPVLQAALADRAAGVIASDTACAEAVAQLQAGRPAGESLAAIRTQKQQTLAFLATLGEYNRQIADYITSVLPPETPIATLAGALVQNE